MISKSNRNFLPLSDPEICQFGIVFEAQLALRFTLNEQNLLGKIKLHKINVSTNSGIKDVGN